MALVLPIAACDDGGGAELDEGVDAGPDAVVDAALDMPLDVADAAPEPQELDFGMEDGQPPDAGRCEGAEPDGGGPSNYRLTLLHADEMRSALVGEGEVGGAARFVTAMRSMRTSAAEGPGRGVLALSAGDHIEAGVHFAPSLDLGSEYYDARALAQAGFDALVPGDQDFDLGPDVFATFIESFSVATTFLAANLDVSDEPRLQSLANSNILTRFTVVETGGERVGIIGLVHSDLARRSAPRGVRALELKQSLALAMEDLDRRSADIVVLVTHIGGVEDTAALLETGTGIDLAVAGGGELLANEGALLHDGDLSEGVYPMWVHDQRCRRVPIVATGGQYKYVGRLVANFDDEGELVDLDDRSGTVRVIGGDHDDAVGPNGPVHEGVEVPVAAAVEELGERRIGRSEVALDGQRNSLRRAETNLGSLIADALLWQAKDLVFGTDLPRADVAVMNGGGIRTNGVIRPGPISELHTFEALPFPSFVTVVPEVSRRSLQILLENAVSRVDDGSGRFAHVAGLSFEWDPEGRAQTIDNDGRVVQRGTRVRSVVIDGDEIIREGQVVAGGPVNVATIDFLARGGDQYLLGPIYTISEVSAQRAMLNYIAGALEGRVGADRYPEGGSERIRRLEPPEVPEEE